MTDRLQPPSLTDVHEAAAAIAEHLSLPTPLVGSPALSEMLGADVRLKYEFATPIGAFKVRGGLNLTRQLTEEQRRAGLVSASTGNHGQSVAFSAHLHGIPATLFVPRGANPDKMASMRRLGATVREEGERFDDACVAAEKFARETGARYVHAGDEPALIAGVATAALEVLDRQQPDTDVAIVPVGGGSGAAGWTIVRDGLSTPTEVWGVQSAQAPAAQDAWRSGDLVARPNTTAAEGVATGTPFALPQRILQGGLNDFLLVEDSEIERALVMLLETQHVLVELAGAAPLAAAVQARERLRGKRVVLVLSGSNITRAQLEGILARAD